MFCVIDLPLAKLAAQLAVGKKLKDMNLNIHRQNSLIAVKKPVFPFNKFPKQNIFFRFDNSLYVLLIGRPERNPSNLSP